MPGSHAVVGRTGSGRTKYLGTLAPPEARWIGEPPIGARTRLQDLGKKGRRDPTRLSEALTAAGLWELRTKTTAGLTEGQRALAEIVAALLDTSETLVVDEWLDWIDPWSRLALWRLMEDRTVILATFDLPLAERCDLVTILGPRGAIVTEAPGELIARVPVERFGVETARGGSVRALIEPFAVDVTEREGWLEFRARKGQELAVKLLLEGYGDVASFVTRRPTLAEAVEHLLG